MNDLKLKSGATSEVSRCVGKPISRVLNRPVNRSLGEKLMLKGQLQLAPFEAIRFDGWGNWEQDPFKNRNWQWRLHWLQFIPYLMAYHHVSGDDAVLDCARDAIASWLDNYLGTDSDYPFEFVWHDHATALRAEQLVLFRYYCSEYAPEWGRKNRRFLTELDGALSVHARLLVEDRFYSKYTNHGLEQSRVLLLLGTVFQGEEPQQWQGTAVERIRGELAASFTGEGVHVENSPAYHIFVFKVFLGIIRDYSEDILGDLGTEFGRFADKAMGFMTHILRPDGKVPPIGDSEQLPTSDAYRNIFGHAPEYQYLLYALSQGKEGFIPPHLNRVYPTSGYAVFRDLWPTEGEYENAFHIIVKGGCSSRYHSQDDEGHVSIYAGGEDWLVDSGMYNYNEKDPVRKYMRAREGHNVPLVTHCKYLRPMERRIRAWQVTAYSEGPPNPYVTMQFDVMPPIVHTRHLAFDADKKVVDIADSICGDDDRLRDVILQWHVPRDKEINIEGQRVEVVGSTGIQMNVEIFGDVPDSLVTTKGRFEDKVESLVSYTANEIEESRLIKVSFKARRSLAVTTRFSFVMSTG